MALLRDPKLLTCVKDLYQYSFCVDLDPEVKMADIAYVPKDEDWCDIEGQPAYEALHWWLKEQSMIFSRMTPLSSTKLFASLSRNMKLRLVM